MSETNETPGLTPGKLEEIARKAREQAEAAHRHNKEARERISGPSPIEEPEESEKPIYDIDKGKLPPGYIGSATAENLSGVEERMKALRKKLAEKQPTPPDNIDQ